MARRLATHHPLYIPIEYIPIRQRIWYPYGLEQIPPGMYRVQPSSSATNDPPMWEFDEAFCSAILDGRKLNLRFREGNWILNTMTGRPEQLPDPSYQDDWREGIEGTFRSNVTPVQYPPYASLEREHRRDLTRLQSQVSMGLVSPTLEPAVSPPQVFRESREREDWLNQMAQMRGSASANAHPDPHQPHGADDYESSSSVVQTTETDPPPSLASSPEMSTRRHPAVATAPSSPLHTYHGSQAKHTRLDSMATLTPTSSQMADDGD